MMSMRSGERRLGALLMEAFMVVFAVLVALGVDQWREDRDVAAQVARAEAGVEAELRANQAELQAGYASVHAMYDSVSSMVARLRNGEAVFMRSRIPGSRQSPEFIEGVKRVLTNDSRIGLGYFAASVCPGLDVIEFDGFEMLKNQLGSFLNEVQ